MPRKAVALGTRAAVPWGWSARKRPEVTVALARVETCWVWKPGRSVQTRECAGRRGRCPSPGTGLCRMGLGWGFEVGRGERLAWAQMWQRAASRVRPELPGERAGMERAEGLGDQGACRPLPVGVTVTPGRKSLWWRWPAPTLPG